tara:strand:- start:4454 stop:4921 length:468 start_codon:yes stop_codon:yes gene_type:complete
MKNILRNIGLGIVALGLSSQAFAGDPVTEITITTDKMNFLYDVKEFTVKAGTTVKITLVVPADAVPQPHNLVIAKPGQEAALIQGAMALMADPEGLTKGYIPDNADVVLAHTKLIQPGGTDVLELEVPAEAGLYPYLCTFPGHFALMKGVMTVVE